MKRNIPARIPTPNQKCNGLGHVFEARVIGSLTNPLVNGIPANAGASERMHDYFEQCLKDLKKLRENERINKTL